MEKQIKQTPGRINIDSLIYSCNRFAYKNRFKQNIFVCELQTNHMKFCGNFVKLCERIDLLSAIEDLFFVRIQKKHKNYGYEKM